MSNAFYRQNELRIRKPIISVLDTGQNWVVYKISRMCPAKTYRINIGQNNPHSHGERLRICNLGRNILKLVGVVFETAMRWKYNFDTIWYLHWLSPTLSWIRSGSKNWAWGSCLLKGINKDSQHKGLKIFWMFTQSASNELVTLYKRVVQLLVGDCFYTL